MQAENRPLTSQQARDSVVVRACQEMGEFWFIYSGNPKSQAVLTPLPTARTTVPLTLACISRQHTLGSTSLCVVVRDSFSSVKSSRAAHGTLRLNLEPIDCPHAGFPPRRVAQFWACFGFVLWLQRFIVSSRPVPPTHRIKRMATTSGNCVDQVASASASASPSVLVSESNTNTTTSTNSPPNPPVMTIPVRSRNMFAGHLPVHGETHDQFMSRLIDGALEGLKEEEEIALVEEKVMLQVRLLHTKGQSETAKRRREILRRSIMLTERSIRENASPEAARERRQLFMSSLQNHVRWARRRRNAGL